MSPSPPVSFAVRVRPSGARARVGGTWEGPHGTAIVVTVTEPAVDGRATEAALRAVAQALGLRRREIALRSGQTSRDKLFTVAAPPVDLEDRLQALREGGR
jgi:uncharacterized protein